MNKGVRIARFYLLAGFTPFVGILSSILIIEHAILIGFASELDELQPSQEIIRSQAESKAKSEFLATMSHEIRTMDDHIAKPVELLTIKEKLIEFLVVANTDTRSA